MNTEVKKSVSLSAFKSKSNKTSKKRLSVQDKIRLLSGNNQSSSSEANKVEQQKSTSKITKPSKMQTNNNKTSVSDGKIQTKLSINRPMIMNSRPALSGSRNRPHSAYQIARVIRDIEEEQQLTSEDEYQNFEVQDEESDDIPFVRKSHQTQQILQRTTSGAFSDQNADQSNCQLSNERGFAAGFEGSPQSTLQRVSEKQANNFSSKTKYDEDLQNTDEKVLEIPVTIKELQSFYSVSKFDQNGKVNYSSNLINKVFATF